MRNLALTSVLLCHALGAQSLTYTVELGGPVQSYNVCQAWSSLNAPVPVPQVQAFGGWQSQAVFWSDSVVWSTGPGVTTILCANGISTFMSLSIGPSQPFVLPGSIFNTPVDQIVGVDLNQPAVTFLAPWVLLHHEVVWPLNANPAAQGMIVSAQFAHLYSEPPPLGTGNTWRILLSQTLEVTL